MSYEVIQSQGKGEQRGPSFKDFQYGGGRLIKDTVACQLELLNSRWGEVFRGKWEPGQ